MVKGRILKKDMIWLRELSISAMFVSIKDIHLREERRNNLLLILVVFKEEKI